MANDDTPTRRRRFRRYTIPASATIEGKQREREYFDALGRFVHAYAQAETVTALALWFAAAIKHPIAKAVFSGVRVKDASSHMKRIADVTGMDKQQRKELDDVLRQLGDITSARNDILHYGAVDVAEGRASVTNALKAHTAEKTTTFDVSPATLAKMTADLRKISMHLRVNFSGIPRPYAAANQLLLATTLHAPWQYKHQPQQKGPAKVEAKPPHGRKRYLRRPRQQPPSPG